VVGPAVKPAPTTPAPPPAEEGSNCKSNRSCPSGDGHSETIKTPCRSERNEESPQFVRSETNCQDSSLRSE